MTKPGRGADLQDSIFHIVVVEETPAATTSSWVFCASVRAFFSFRPNSRRRRREPPALPMPRVSHRARFGDTFPARGTPTKLLLRTAAHDGNLSVSSGDAR